MSGGSRGAAWLGIMFCGVCLPLASRAADADERFAALRADGQFAAGEEVASWHDENAKPHLSGKAVFDDNQPFRWLVDQTQPIAPRPEAYLEMIGGDRLPAETLAWQDGGRSPYRTLPDYLVTRPAFEFASPREPYQKTIRARVDWLRRVVWQELPHGEYRPGHVFLRDGRRLRFRSLRWNPAAVVVLLEDGIQTIPFADLAEVHLPRQDPWNAYYEQLAVLSTGDDARLLRLDTSDGARLTTSTERFRPTHHGNAGKPDDWYQIVQPAWSLDPLWLRYRTIRTWSFFAPHQVPLTAFTPEVERRPLFGSAWRPRRDRSAQGTPLRAGGHLFGWGWGVHGETELRFSLTPAARTFRARVGLDRLASGGGCVKTTIALAGPNAKRLHQSQPLVGSEQVVDTGSLNLSGSTAETELVLSVDPLHEDRPEGADPFDIRDSLDWLMPELELDPQKVKEEIAKRRLKMLPALGGWQLAGDGAEAIIVRQEWDERDRLDPRFRVLLGVKDRPFLAFSKTLAVPADARWLALMASRPRDGKPSRLQVRVAGRTVAEVEVPQENGALEPRPILLPLPKLDAPTVEIEIAQIPDGDDAYVAWRGVKLLAHRPGLRKLFDDEPEFAARLRSGEGEAALVEGEKNVAVGRAAIRVTPPGRWTARLDGLQAAIRESPDLGQYRYLRFSWRSEGAELVGLGVAHDEQLGIGTLVAPRRDELLRYRPFRPDHRGAKSGYRLVAGTGEFDDHLGLRVEGRAPDKEWKTVTRDLYGDFGAFTLTGLALLCREGEALYVDQIYLARTREDFEHLPTPGAKPAEPQELEPNVARRATDPLRYGELLAGVAPRFALIETGEGPSLIREHRGKQNVLRTMPPRQGEDCVLRAAVVLPKDEHSQLKLSVSHEDEGDWQLQVRANGEKLHDSLIGKDTVKDGWADLTIDLGKFAGKAVLLEIHQHPNNWKNEAAYWSQIEIATP